MGIKKRSNTNYHPSKGKAVLVYTRQRGKYYDPERRSTGGRRKGERNEYHQT